MVSDTATQRESIAKVRYWQLIENWPSLQTQERERKATHNISQMWQRNTSNMEITNISQMGQRNTCNMEIRKISQMWQTNTCNMEITNISRMGQRNTCNMEIRGAFMPRKVSMTSFKLLNYNQLYSQDILLFTASFCYKTVTWCSCYWWERVILIWLSRIPPLPQNKKDSGPMILLKEDTQHMNNFGNLHSKTTDSRCMGFGPKLLQNHTEIFQ